MKKLIIVTRHGFRHPKKVPNDGTTLDYNFNYLKYENIRQFVPVENIKDKAFLTQQGYELALKNSQIIKQQYGDFLNDIKQEDIRLKTSDFQRTFYTLCAFYFGLFDKMIPENMSIEQQDRAIDEMYANASRPLNKYFLKCIFETVVTKNEIHMYNQMLKSTDWTIDDVDDYLQQRQEHLTDTQKELFKMTHPKWEDYWNTYYFVFKSQEEKIKIVRPLYGHVAQYFLDRIIKPSQYKLEIYSGHDSTLSTLLTCFQFNKKYHRHPFYADFMCIEVHDSFIRVYALIDGTQEYLQFENGDIICTFQDLEHHMQQYSISKQDADQCAEQWCQKLEQFY